MTRLPTESCVGCSADVGELRRPEQRPNGDRYGAGNADSISVVSIGIIDIAKESVR